jgi:L-alanine-DL-glutamate epimerase-like enolase superfamily enzyme
MSAEVDFGLMAINTFTIRSVQAFCYRYPLSTPVVTSFGRMLSRPAVFVRVEDTDGHAGWGEAWCNFPSVGAEHRGRLINEILAPAAVGCTIGAPDEMFGQLTAGIDVLALQSGEPGPFAQAIAGIDIALWDLWAQRARQPLWRMLGGTEGSVRVYASGINPSGTLQQAEAALKRGHRALKLKIGFDPATDRANLAALAKLVDPGRLAADANQAWSIERALDLAPDLAAFNLAWLEEPIRADRPWQEWQKLAEAARVPLAAGENIASHAGFAQALTGDVLKIVQPDIAKWGGLSVGAKLARDILSAGKTLCPHYLGGGVGLLASAHLLAAAGGPGSLEVDSNDNPLRDEFCGPVAQVSNGMVTLGDAPGLGIKPDLASIERYRTA